jgi:predicted metal-dependent hydrolase
VDELVHRGIRLFNDAEFFACHEVLEEAWVVERGARRRFLQAVIHVAVGFYHSQRGNPRGASGQLGKALHKLSAYLPSYESIDTRRLYSDVLIVAELIDAGSPVVEYPQIHLLI